MTAASILAAAFVDDPVCTELFLVDRAAAIWTRSDCPDCERRLIEGLSGLLSAHHRDDAKPLLSAVAEAAVQQLGPNLHWLGVLPDARGRGAGRALLRELADDAGPAWATTCNPEAVPFYLACGWAVLAEKPVAGHPALTCWTLRAG